jgi:hypothetical protein
VVHLLAVLRSRISAFADGGDPIPILSRDAESDAAQLVRAAQQSSPDGSLPLDVVYILAWFYWYRSRAQPDLQHDLQSALDLFAILARTSPELVPSELAAPDLVAEGLPGGDPDQWVHAALVILGEISATGDPLLLKRAVDLLRRAFAEAPAAHPQRAAYASHLGAALQMRFAYTGELADLDDAVRAITAAVAATPADDANRPAYLSNLCAVYGTRFERTGNRADLDIAVQAAREACNYTPLNHPLRAANLFNLGLSLRNLFTETGSLTDLDQAVEAIENAVRAASRTTRVA